MEDKTETPFAHARRVMREEFEKDMEPGSLYDGYVANVAMLLHDQYGIKAHNDRTRAAKDILRLIFAK